MSTDRYHVQAASDAALRRIIAVLEERGLFLTEPDNVQLLLISILDTLVVTMHAVFPTPRDRLTFLDTAYKNFMQLAATSPGPDQNDDAALETLTFLKEHLRPPKGLKHADEKD